MQGYAYDTLLLIRDDIEMVKNVDALLLWFEVASSLHVNMSKTNINKIGEVGCWHELLHEWN